MSQDRFPCHHLALFVEDLEKITDFYHTYLGFRSAHDFTADRDKMKIIFDIDSSCRIRYLERDGFRVELIQFTEFPLPSGKGHARGYNHWTMLVENKTQFADDLEQSGVPLIRCPKTEGVILFVRDPEDNLIELKSFEEVRS